MMRQLRIGRTVVGAAIGLALWAQITGAQEKKDPPKTVPSKPTDTKAVVPDPPTVADLDRKAAALIEQGKGQDAVPLLRQAVGLDPKSIQTRILLGRAYASVKQ
ncbi:MAG: hypothetical protein JWL77_4033, partial [Chthonomonadaceae bacterium]|nr:hypothetical protein [Chthonomonadaceae bacterium]